MSLRVFYDILNQKGTPAFYTDTLANRPAFGFAGRVFISTDSGQIFEDTGSAWTLIADAGVGGGTLSSVCLNGNTTATGIVITAGGLSTNSITNTGNTVGSVLFAGTGGLESQSNATFFWDNTNKRLGIGNATPGAPLDVHGTGTQIQVNGTGANNSYIQFQNAGTSKWRIGNNYNAGANSFDIFNNGLSNTPFSINSSTNLITLTANVTTTGIQSVQNGLNLGYASGGSVTNYTNVSGSTSGINFALGNGTGGATFIFQTLAGYTYTFPATTGTLALTSNLSSYLPLSGGSLTGNLSTNSYISIQNGLGTNQIYLTKSSGDVYGTIQTEASGNKFSLGNVSNIGTLGTPNITWTSSMLVGINNSSPSYELDVSGTMRTSATQPSSIINYTNATSYGNLIFSELGSNKGIIQYIGSTFATTSRRNNLEIVNAANSDMTLWTNNTERMRLTSTGSLGIGTASPSYILDVQTSAVTQARFRGSSTDAAIIRLENSTSTQTYGIGAAGSANLGGAPNNSFYVRDETANAVRLAITSGGNVLIGISTDGGFKLNVSYNGTVTSLGVNASNGNVYLYSLGTGIVYSNGGYLTSTNPSDSRLKDNIEDIQWGLNDILKLRPVKYNWKEDKINQGIQFGFIAQEVEKIMPEAVKEFGEDVKYLGLEKDAIYATLVKAIQELNEKLVRNNIN